MWGIITRAVGSNVSPLDDVAGLPLVCRQLLWLREVGCERVVVEVGPGAAGIDLARYLAEGHAVGMDVIPVLRSTPLGPAGLLARAGARPGTPALVVPGDVIGRVEVTRLFRELDAGTVYASLPAPASLTALRAGHVGLVRDTGRVCQVNATGWSVALSDRTDVFLVSCAILSGSLGPATGATIVPGTPDERGAHLGRGAVIEDGAEIVGPVLLGPGAIVRSGARVGPHAVLGADAVVERGATVVRARIAPSVIVGEGLALREMEALAEGLRPFDETSELVTLGDPLLLSARDTTRLGPAVWAARLALFFAWPILALSPRVGRLVAPLTELARGARTLVGVGPRLRSPRRGLDEAAARAPRGLFDVEPALVRPGADLETRLRARAWYAAHKSFPVDVKLFATTLVQRACAPRRVLEAPRTIVGAPPSAR